MNEHDRLTKVINIHHKVPYDIYIGRGRGSIWGNPFSHMENTKAEFKVNTRDEAVDAYLPWILDQPQLLELLYTLKNKVLGCFCSPKRCHGDMLISLVNFIFNHVEEIKQRARESDVRVGVAIKHVYLKYNQI